ncbi:MAG: porin [Ginsengibacter sp.]
MKSILFSIAMALCSQFCLAQTNSTAVDSTSSKSTLTLAAVYSNDASYYGQRAAEKIPYAAVAVNYQLPSGIYFTGQTYKLLNDNNSTLSAGSLGAGVNFKLAKNLTTDLSYSHSFYAANSPFLQAANADNASVAFSFEKWITASVTGDYAFGETNDAFVTTAISKQISLFSIGKKDVVTITPSADMVAGTQYFYQSYIKQKKIRDSILGNLPIPIFGRPNSNHADTIMTKETAFNLLSYNFKLPLDYNRGNYVIEAAYQLSLLSNHVQTTTGNVNSFFTFSFYYQF